MSSLFGHRNVDMNSKSELSDSPSFLVNNRDSWEMDQRAAVLTFFRTINEEQVQEKLQEDIKIKSIYKKSLTSEEPTRGETLAYDLSPVTGRLVSTEEHKEQTLSGTIKAVTGEHDRDVSMEKENLTLQHVQVECDSIVGKKDFSEEVLLKEDQVSIDEDKVTSEDFLEKESISSELKQMYSEESFISLKDQNVSLKELYVSFGKQIVASEEPNEPFNHPKLLLETNDFHLQNQKSSQQNQHASKEKQGVISQQSSINEVLEEQLEEQSLEDEHETHFVAQNVPNTLLKNEKNVSVVVQDGVIDPHKDGCFTEQQGNSFDNSNENHPCSAVSKDLQRFLEEPHATLEDYTDQGCLVEDQTVDQRKQSRQENTKELKKDSMCVISNHKNPPDDCTITRATFSPGLSTNRSTQLPPVLSGLRVLRKGIAGPERETLASIRPPSTVPGETLEDGKAQGSFLDQISQILNWEKNGEERDLFEGSFEEKLDEQSQGSELEVRGVVDVKTKPNSSSAEAAFDAFKAFFTPKPLKKEPGEKLDAMMRKIKADRDVLKALFERMPCKTTATTTVTEDTSDDKVESSTPVEEERTPGRLQAVWPPLKEERVGLKYTEAEHQAALLHLKRECKDEQDKLQGEFSEQIYRLNAEHQKNVSLLQLTLAEMRAELSHVGSLRREELRDVAVLTGDEHLHKSFRTVCIQTDREAFVKTPQDGVTPVQQKICPNKLDLCLNQAGQRQETLSHDCPPPPVDKPSPVTQTTSEQTINLPPPPPPLPPPPFRPSLAPPPPPPLTFGMTSLEKKPRKPAVDPSRPMKPLYWTRIQIEDNNSGTLWNTLEEPNIVNAAEFESLFAKTSTQSKRKPLAETYEKKSKARKIKLLDGKRSQAVGILISSLHLEMKDIQQAILSVDQSVVDLETIEALYENRAQPDELERIKKHYQTCQEDDIKLLDKPEQFLYELAQIPDFAGRARCIIFRSSFTDGITTIQRKLHMVSSVCQALLASTSVRDVMGLVLAFGNRMNGGSQVRGQADGFCLEILPKLKDVKSQDNRINLVDYVVSYYLHNLDKNAGSDKSLFPLPEPQDVFTAAQVKFEDLNQDLRQLGRDLTGSENDVQRVCSNSPEKHLQPFQDKMEAFLLTAREDHVEASHQLTTTQKSFLDLVQYFGLKPKAGEKDVTPAQFFTLWFEFCADFKVRWKRENKNVSKERLKEAQMLVKRMTSEKRVETRRVNPNSLKERLRQKQAGVSS